MEQFNGRVLKGDNVLHPQVEGVLHTRSTVGAHVEWSGNMIIPGSTPAMLSALLVEPRLRLELDDGRAGEFFVVGMEAPGFVLRFQGTGPLE